MRLLTPWLLALLVLGGCDRPQTGVEPTPDVGGARYKADLRAQIVDADRIVVSEHSFWMDFAGRKTAESHEAHEVVYKRIELTRSQREGFLSAVDSLPPQGSEILTRCAFQPHHRIDFYVRGRLASSMEICFVCVKVKWTGSESTPPQALYAGLAAFIEAIGMRPHQNWRLLAAGHEG